MFSFWVNVDHGSFRYEYEADASSDEAVAVCGEDPSEVFYFEMVVLVSFVFVFFVKVLFYGLCMFFV